MSRKAIVVAGLSAVVIAASGCGGDSDISKFRAALEERFGETSWYVHITGMKMSSGGLEITTDLDSSDGTADTFPCLAVYSLAAELGLLDGGEAVVVTGADGVGLGGCA